jgi:DNA-binding response OmpR family regulator
MVPSDSSQLPTVLVIDDEPVILRTVRATLSPDHQLLEADTALKALEVSENFRGVIDLVVADHTLKDATGQQVVAQIRTARPEIRVLYFSTYSRDHLTNEGLPADAEILEKPFLPRDLRGAIFRLLRAQPDQPGAGDSVDRNRPECAIESRNPECVERLREEIFLSRSLFGRLFSASKLRNWSKSRYEHRLSVKYGIDDVDDAVRVVHHEALVLWLDFSLRQQKSDVAIYLHGTADPGSEVKRLPALGKAVLPQTAIEAERQLFLSDLSVIQMLLQYEL